MRQQTDRAVLDTLRLRRQRDHAARRQVIAGLQSTHVGGGELLDEGVVAFVAEGGGAVPYGDRQREGLRLVTLVLVERRLHDGRILAAPGHRRFFLR